MKPIRRKLNRKNVLILTLVTIVLLITAYFVGCNFKGSKTPATVSKELEATGRVNILLLGMDARPGEKIARSDTIILLTLDQTTKKVSLLSIPRDSRVEIPGHGVDKINAALGIGGPDLSVQVVSSLLNQEIDYYVMTRLDGFKEIIDTLGGVTIDVEKNMRYTGMDGKGNVDVAIDLKKGLQHLDGEKALEYVRFRHDALGDITRTQRQQKLLKSLAEVFMKPSTIIKVPALIPKMFKTVETNLTFRDVLSLINLAKGLDREQIVTLTLPGSFSNQNGVSYWKVSDEAKDIVNELVEGNAPTQVIETASSNDEITQVVWKSKPKPKEEPLPVTDVIYEEDQTLPTDPDQVGTNDPQPVLDTDPPGTEDGQPDDGTGTTDPGTTDPGNGEIEPQPDVEPNPPDPDEGTIPPTDPLPEQTPPETQG